MAPKVQPATAAVAPARAPAPVNSPPAAEASSTPRMRLGPLSGVLGYHVAQAAVVTGGSFERHVGQPLGLRKVEYSLLLLLRVNGPQSPKRMGQALTLSAPNLTLLLDRLQGRGLINRERSLTDRRSQNIVLTDAGRLLAEQGTAAIDAMEADVATRLSHAERLMLIELLRKVAGK